MRLPCFGLLVLALLLGGYNAVAGPPAKKINGLIKLGNAGIIPSYNAAATAAINNAMAGTLTLNGVPTYSGGAILTLEGGNTYSGGVTFSSGSADVTGIYRTNLTVSNGNYGGTITSGVSISGVITLAGGSSLFKAGTSTLVLGATTTYADVTTFTLGSTLNFAGTSLLTLGNPILSGVGSALIINANTLTVTSPLTLSTAALVRRTPH